MKQLVYIGTIFILFLVGCKKEYIQREAPVPAHLNFLIDSAGTYLIKSSKQEIKMWYLLGIGGRNYVPLRIDSMQVPSKYGYQFKCLAFTGYEHQNYYLQIGNGKIDSIYYDVSETPELAKEGWYYYYNIREVRINGRLAEIEHDDGIYILRK